MAGVVSSHALVLLHQTASAGVMFDALMPHLDVAFVVAPDTPGFGNSFIPSEPFSISVAADAIYSALARAGIKTFDLFGHHTGAAVAVQIATEHPHVVRKIALSGPPLLTDAQKEGLTKTIAPPVLDESGSYLLSTWNRIRKRAPQAPRTFTLRETLLTLSVGTRYPEAYHAVFAMDFGAQLKTLFHPVLVLGGEHDPLRASVEPTAALLANSQIAIIPDAGPFMCDLQPPQVAALLNPFYSDSQV
jgi:pimeloyl-ACP methyl ester carboxylesterase